MSNAIELNKVTYTAGKSFQISDLNLHVPEGAIYGFLGANGSGKTTTIRLIMGMLRAEAGHISVLGENVPNDMPSILGRTGYVPERPHLYPGLTVGETLRSRGRIGEGQLRAGRGPAPGRPPNRRPDVKG